MAETKHLYIFTTHDPFCVDEIEDAFKKNTTWYKVNTWNRVFLDSSLPIEQCEVRHYWQFRAMVTKEQEEVIKKVAHDIQYAMRRKYGS